MTDINSELRDIVDIPTRKVIDDFCRMTHHDGRTFDRVTMCLTLHKVTTISLGAVPLENDMIDAIYLAEGDVKIILRTQTRTSLHNSVMTPKNRTASMNIAMNHRLPKLSKPHHKAGQTSRLMSVMGGALILGGIDVQFVNSKDLRGTTSIYYVTKQSINVQHVAYGIRGDIETYKFCIKRTEKEVWRIVGQKRGNIVYNDTIVEQDDFELKSTDVVQESG